MAVQEVMLKAVSGELHWFRAAEILGWSSRTLRRWRERYEAHGYGGCSTSGGSGRRHGSPPAILRVLDVFTTGVPFAKAVRSLSNNRSTDSRIHQQTVPVVVSKLRHGVTRASCG